jgi:hypothetical protein
VARLSRPDHIFTAMARLADDRPSIFSGSFQEAALYQFQTGKPSGLVSTAGVRRTQYELWKRHAEWQQKSVVVFGAEGPQAQWLSIGHRGIGYLISDHLQSPELLHIQQISIQDGAHPDSLQIDVWVKNPINDVMDRHHADFPFRWVLCTENRESKSTDTLPARCLPEPIRFEPHKTSQIEFGIHRSDVPKGPIMVGLQTIFGLQFPDDPNDQNMAVAK